MIMLASDPVLLPVTPKQSVMREQSRMSPFLMPHNGSVFNATEFFYDAVNIAIQLEGWDRGLKPKVVPEF